MATEAQLKSRIGSVKNIQKITSAMKMVAAAKLRNAQTALTVGKAFIGGLEKAWAPVENKLTGKSPLIVAFSSDKGLCGGVHSVIQKEVRALLAQAIEGNKEEANPSVFVIGERCKSGLERSYAQYFLETVTESGKLKPISFLQASQIADLVLENQKSDELKRYDQTLVIYNRYKSAISYVPTVMAVPSPVPNAEEEKWFEKFEFEGNKEEVLESYHQFRTACRFYYWTLEAQVSEQSSRVTAMDNSSTNAKEMLDKLNIVYNRNRQARITTELIEIISGASAAAEQVK